MEAKFIDFWLCVYVEFNDCQYATKTNNKLFWLQALQ